MLLHTSQEIACKHDKGKTVDGDGIQCKGKTSQEKTCFSMIYKANGKLTRGSIDSKEGKTTGLNHTNDGYQLITINNLQ